MPIGHCRLCVFLVLNNSNNVHFPISPWSTSPIFKSIITKHLKLMIKQGQRKMPIVERHPELSFYKSKTLAHLKASVNYRYFCSSSFRNIDSFGNSKTRHIRFPDDVFGFHNFSAFESLSTPSSLCSGQPFQKHGIFLSFNSN